MIYKCKHLLSCALVLYLGMAGGEIKAQQFSAAVSGGLNLTSVGGSDVSSQSSLLRLNLGFWGKYDLAENITAHVGALYSGNGAKLGSYKFKLNYLQIPVYAGYKVFEQDAIKAHILAGGYLGIKVGASVDPSDPSIPGSVSDYINTTDFGLSIGTDVEVLENISIRATYNYGLLKVVNTGGGGLIGGGQNIFNRFLQVGVVYTLYKL